MGHGVKIKKSEEEKKGNAHESKDCRIYALTTSNFKRFLKRQKNRQHQVQGQSYFLRILEQGWDCHITKNGKIKQGGMRSRDLGHRAYIWRSRSMGTIAQQCKTHKNSLKQSKNRA